MNTLPRITFLLFAGLYLASCAPSRAELSKHSLPAKEKPSFVFIKNVDYDQHGLPLFQPKLRKQPTKAGEQYTLVYFVKDRAIKSFDIVIVEEKIDLERPKNVLYQWTGNGFQVGAQLGMNFTFHARGKEGLVVLAIGAVMPLAGGLVGFAIGTMALLPQGVQDLGSMFSTGREAIISITEYEYDMRGRLKQMKMLQPGEPASELIRTVFSYEQNETVPSKTEVYSAPENKTRIIQ